MNFHSFTRKLSIAVASGLVLSSPISFANTNSPEKRVDVVMESVIDHQFRMDELRRQAELKKAQADLLLVEAEMAKVHLEKKRTEAEIRDIDKPAEEKVEEPAAAPAPVYNRTDGGGLISPKLMEMASKLGDLDKQLDRKSSSTPGISAGSTELDDSYGQEIDESRKMIERLHVLRIFGSSEPEATIIADGSTFIVKAGDLVNGVKVVKISDNSVQLSHNGENRTAFIVSKKSVK